MVCLSCTATGERVCLAAEGFGNRHCFLENIADKNIPPDLSQCVFVIEQALSVRALQELVTAAGSETVSTPLSPERTTKNCQRGTKPQNQSSKPTSRGILILNIATTGWDFPTQRTAQTTFSQALCGIGVRHLDAQGRLYTSHLCTINFVWMVTVYGEWNNVHIKRFKTKDLKANQLSYYD